MFQLVMRYRLLFNMRVYCVTLCSYLLFLRSSVNSSTSELRCDPVLSLSITKSSAVAEKPPDACARQCRAVKNGPVVND